MQDIVHRTQCITPCTSPRITPRARLHRASRHALRSTACFHRTTHAAAQDAATAHALGLLLGRRVLLLGCSTGGSLALWLASQPWVGGLVGLVLVSPGLRLSMPSLQWTVLGWLALLLPRAAAHGLVRAANGGPIKKANDDSEMYLRYWTSAYPIGAVLHPVHLFRILGSTLDCAPPPIALATLSRLTSHHPLSRLYRPYLAPPYIALTL